MALAISTSVPSSSIMVSAISNALRYPHLQIAQRNSSLTLPTSKSPSFLRLPKGRVLQSRIVIRAASSAAGNPQSDADFNLYEVLGVNPIEGFDKIKQTYGRKLKDAQKSGDEATAALWLELKYCKNLTSLPLLPPNLQCLNVHGCTSLRTVTSPLARPLPSEQIHSTFIFTNCHELEQVSKNAIISYIQKKSELMSPDRYNQAKTKSYWSSYSALCIESMFWK